MKKIWIHIGIFAFALSILVFYYCYLNMKWVEDDVMNRAQVARMLALLYCDSNACEEFFQQTDKEKMPSDITEDSWYEKYVAVVLEKQWMQADEMGNFLPGDAFTYKDLKHIMDCFYINENMLSFSLKYRQSDGYVQNKHWFEVFNLMCVGQQEVQKVERSVYGSPETMSDLSAWQVKTDDGIKMAEGLSVESYMNQRVEVYERNNDILCIIGAISDEIFIQEDMELENKNIRVILHANPNDYEHDFVQVTSDKPFYVIAGQDIWKYEANEYVTFKKEDGVFGEESVVIKTENDMGKIQILSLERACGNPFYDGSIHLQKGEEGILVINEIDIEDYVAGVIPSEMPVGWGMEALKAQAVCARTFAYRSLTDQFQEYPANVDDTVFSQVYNNQLACQESIQATKETEGFVLKNGNGFTPTYFFSTSCGHTSVPEDVWYDGGSENSSDAVAVFLTNETIDLNLSHEPEFRLFIDQEDNITYYEQDLPWFRWQVFISDEMIEDKLTSLFNQDIGDLNQVQVVERGSSGVLKSLRFIGNMGECQIHGEYRIRQIFSPKGAELIPQSGEIVSDWELLPSGYFYMDALVEDEICEGYLLHGGGYGHGCGMSQYGAMKMSEMGYDYRDILNCFFSESEIVKE